MSETITTFNIYKIKQELLNKFRYGFNDLDTKERILETTATFSGDGITKKFTLSPTNMAYVKSVTVDGSILSYGSEWDIIWRGNDKGRVEFTTAPADGTDNITVIWGNTGNNSNFIWSDFPKETLGIHNYPRIGFKTTTSSRIAGMCGDAHVLKNEVLIQIKIVDTDIFNIDYIGSEIREWILSNAKNFYYFNFITAQNIGEFDNFDDNTSETHYKILEFIVPDKLEKVTFV